MAKDFKLKHVKTMELLLKLRLELVSDFDQYIYSVRNGLDEDEEYTNVEDVLEDLRQVVFPSFLAKKMAEKKKG